MRQKELTLNPELPITLDQPPTIKVIARRPNQQQAKLSARSKKKDRFSSQDFLGFYSPTHQQYDSLQKGKLDLSKVFPRTPSKDLKDPKQCKDVVPFKHEQALSLNKTPPTKSQLRVRLKLNEISNNEFQNARGKRLQEGVVYGTAEKVGRENVEQKRQGTHIHLTSKGNAVQGSLVEENRRFKEENIRLVETIARMKENLEDCHRKITRWQQGEIEKEVQIRALQLQNAEYKSENYALFKNNSAKDELNASLQKNLDLLRHKLDQQSNERDIQRRNHLETHNKLQYLQQLTKNYMVQLQKQRQKCKYLEIEIQVVKQKKFQLENCKSSHQQKTKLMQDNRKWRQQVTRLKNKLTYKDELFQLSP